MSVKSDVKHSKKKQKSNALRNFIIVVVIIAGGVALMMNANFQQLMDGFSQDGMSVSSEIFDNQVSSGDQEERSYERQEEDKASADSDEGFLSFAPEDSMEVLNDEQLEDFNPYSQIVREDESAANAARAEKLEKAFDEYRVYLENANRLLVKFAGDEIYSEELEVIKSVQFSSSEAQEVLMLLEVYNKHLVEQGPVTSEVVDIKLLDSEVLEKIVKIKKVRMSNVDQRELKEKIEAKLNVLMDYIFSESLQKLFMNK